MPSSPKSENPPSAEREDLSAVLTRVADALERIEKVESLVLSTDPSKPGIAMRLDRIEQMLHIFRWIGGGGLIGLIGTLALLYQIAAALSVAKGGM